MDTNQTITSQLPIEPLAYDLFAIICCYMIPLLIASIPFSCYLKRWTWRALGSFGLNVILSFRGLYWALYTPDGADHALAAAVYVCLGFCALGICCLCQGVCVESFCGPDNGFPSFCEFCMHPSRMKLSDRIKNWPVILWIVFLKSLFCLAFDIMLVATGHTLFVAWIVGECAAWILQKQVLLEQYEADVVRSEHQIFVVVEAPPIDVQASCQELERFRAIGKSTTVAGVAPQDPCLYVSIPIAQTPSLVAGPPAENAVVY